MFISLILALLAGTDDAAAAPWKANRPIVTVQRQLYHPHSQPRTAAYAGRAYVGPKLEMMEWRWRETQDDVWDENESRWSDDNGRTWSDFFKRDRSTNVKYGDVLVWEGGSPRGYDPTSGRLVELWLRQIQRGPLVHNFTYVRTSVDAGRNWTTPEQLRYEEGEAFDPAEPLKASFLLRNQGMPGNSILIRQDGRLVCPLSLVRSPNDPQNDSRPWKLGSLCFIGTWDKPAGVYRWTAGKPVAISAELSSRGLMEPDLAELADQRVLAVWRGSSTPTTPGRKWFSISHDGGRSFAPVAEWKYSDGSRFYSPSSYHRLVRHSVTGKLYWFGNICAAPPAGNNPRYPLVIAEVDEETAAIKRDTVTVIDDRRPGQSPNLQLSNFSLLENRETHNFELHMTLYGEQPKPEDWASADNYRYTLMFR